jgi:hypothetical protein
MLPYYISQSNAYAIRTDVTSSNTFTMNMQNMYTLENTTMSLSGITYNGYESLLQFTGSIASASVATEYRLELFNSGTTDPIWHGSLQSYKSQSVDKSVYENQIPPVISHESENRYIIID